MKTILILLLTIFSIHIAAAQTDSIKAKSQIVRICAPSRARLLAQPLFVFYAKKKELYRSNPSTNKMDPMARNMIVDAIEAVNVLKGDESVKKYGAAGTNGVVEIYLKRGYRKMRKAVPDTTTNNMSTNIRYRGDKIKLSQVPL